MVIGFVRRLAVAGAIVGALALLAACGTGQPAHRGDPGTATSSAPPGTSPPASSSATATTPASTPGSSPGPSPSTATGRPVHVSLFEGDGQTYGVAMPIIAYFSVAPTSAVAFDKAVTVEVNGTPVHGAWYWEPSSRSDEAMEAHYRLATYWPAHSTVTMQLPVAGLSAGAGLVFADSLSLSMRTGAAQVVKIDGAPGVDSMKVYSDGTLIHTFRISLGAAKTPTYLGTAVVMSKSNPQLMVSSPGEPYYRIEVPWSVRVTYDGEFLHDAYWNGQLGHENLSHGCTNMSPADAKWYYHWSQIGDPVSWTHTGTARVLPVADGWGDWNLSFARYEQGGLLPPA